MRHRIPGPLALSALVAVLVAAGVAYAQAPSMEPREGAPVEVASPPHPFGPGEMASYQVKLGAVVVGSGSMHVVGMEDVHGEPTYHARFRLSGGIPLARVDDKFESWIDAEGLFSRRFKQDQKEVRFKRNRTYEFFPERREYRQLDNGKTGSIPTDRPLDDVSFLYYARTLPLRVGDTYSLHRYFKAEGNPVVLKVLRHDTVKVPAGTFKTVVVRPIIKTDGLFSEGGEAEVHFSDDARKIPVQIRSKVPVIGSLTMSLREYRAPGGS